MQTDSPSAGRLRIGELSRRVGVSTELLRAWERRYGLLSPTRTAGGFRLYADADEQRVRRMLLHLAAGVSAAEGARLALLESADLAPGAAPADTAPGALSEQLRAALDRFDDAAAHAALDNLLATFAVETVLRDAVLPYLHELGERWERGDVSVAQEHFASNLLRGRLLALGRGWGRGAGRHALLAAPPGEQHDLGLVVLALALRDRGWRITFLGADTPIETIVDTARRLAPEVVVLATLAPPEDSSRAEVRELARDRRVILSGAGITDGVAADVGAEHFADGPLEAATYLANRAAG